MSDQLDELTELVLNIARRHGWDWYELGVEDGWWMARRNADSPIAARSKRILVARIAEWVLLNAEDAS